MNQAALFATTRLTNGRKTEWMARRVSFFRPLSPFDRWNTLPKRSASCPFSGISWESIRGFPMAKKTPIKLIQFPMQAHNDTRILNRFRESGRPLPRHHAGSAARLAETSGIED